MIFQDELITNIMSEAGQVALSPAMLKFDDALITRDFFIPLVKKYAHHRPKKRYLRIDIGSTGITAPYDLIRVQNLRLYYDYFVGPVSVDTLPKTMYEHRDGKIYADPGDYLVEYFSFYTIVNKIPQYRVYDANVETNIIFTLRGKAVPETIKIYYGSDTATSDVSGNITGPNITSGTYNLTTYKIDITFTSSISDIVYVEFTSSNPVVLELDMIQDVQFMDLFASKFTTAFGTAKSIVRIDGLPFDITVDELMAFGKEKLQEWKEALESHQDWWEWAVLLFLMPSFLNIMEKIL